MDLTGVTQVLAGAGPGPDGLPAWRPGDAWLAGGTWLFSQPQPGTTRLLDLTTLGWPALEPVPADGVAAQGVRVGATCTVAELYAAATRPPGWAAGWTAGRLVRQCCDAFLAPFKVWNVATVGGNLCNGLPAGPMIALAVALDGVCELLHPDGSGREVPAAGFVLDDGRTVLAPGEVLRAVRFPAAALRSRTALRRASLTALGRSSALVAGRVLRPEDAGDGTPVTVTVTAATRHPVVLGFDRLPAPGELAEAVDAAVPDGLWFDDVHGHPAWRRRRTLDLAEEVRAALAGPPVEPGVAA